MTVREVHEALAQAIARGCGNWIVSVPFKPATPVMGGSPVEPVTLASRGFDWDTGRLLLYTKTPLGPSGEKLEEVGRKADRAAQAIYLARRALLSKDSSPEERIGEALRALEAQAQRPASRTSRP